MSEKSLGASNLSAQYSWVFVNLSLSLLRSRFLMNYVLFVLIFFSISSYCLACNKAYTGFIDNPTKENYELYAASFVSHNEQTLCESSKENEYLHKLLKLVREDNVYAIDIAFRELDISQGGNLGDIYRELASVIERNPEIIVDNIIKYSFDEAGMRGLAVMLPLTYSDDFDMQLDVMKKRIGKIKALDDLKYKSEKILLLQIMKKELEQLESIVRQESMGSAE